MKALCLNAGINRLECLDYFGASLAGDRAHVGFLAAIGILEQEQHLHVQPLYATADRSNRVRRGGQQGVVQGRARYPCTLTVHRQIIRRAAVPRMVGKIPDPAAVRAAIRGRVVPHQPDQLRAVSSAQPVLEIARTRRPGDRRTDVALTSHRFLATFFLAIPAGLWLRGKPLRKPLLIGAVLFPLTALASLETVRLGAMTAASVSFLAMGFAGLILNVASLPMMLRLAPPKQSSEALSLLFATWGAASICGGVLSSVLQSIGHLDLGTTRVVLDEHATLPVLTCSPPWV